jgi:hypothetical protein
MKVVFITEPNRVVARAGVLNPGSTILLFENSGPPAPAHSYQPRTRYVTGGITRGEGAAAGGNTSKSLPNCARKYSE